MTVERREPVVQFAAQSRGNHDTTSIVGTAMFNGFSINHGFTPRRSYNTASVTLEQLSEIVATLINDITGNTPTYKT